MIQDQETWAARRAAYSRVGHPDADVMRLHLLTVHGDALGFVTTPDRLVTLLHKSRHPKCTTPHVWDRQRAQAGLDLLGTILSRVDPAERGQS